MTKETDFFGFHQPDDLDLGFGSDTPAAATPAPVYSEPPHTEVKTAVTESSMDFFNSSLDLDWGAPAEADRAPVYTAPPAHTPPVQEPVYTAPIPKAETTGVFTTPENPFMTTGDLISVADGRHTEGKGSSWDDFALTKNTTVIGRAARCDLVIKQSGISIEHARITRKGDAFILTNRSADAGTYVNGVRIEEPVVLREKDQISFADRNYVFSAGRLIYSKNDDPETRSAALRTMAPSARPVVLQTNIKTKRVKNNSGVGTKELIRDIQLNVKEGSLVAMLGTAGAGKSTVMNCMNGMDLEGVVGSAHYRGVDLVHNFEQMKHLIGCVPQKKIFHPSFTPEEEFMQAAMLRLPADTTQREIKERVNKTLEMLSMNDVRRNRNSKLSGGEQTRVNVGIELVADRDLLCLDEPDQGLSPNYKHELFTILQNLAHNHCKTVISIIHDVSEIDMFDQVIILTKMGGVGRLAYSGSPSAAREHFGVEIRDVYSLLEREPTRFVR